METIEILFYASEIVLVLSYSATQGSRPAFFTLLPKLLVVLKSMKGTLKATAGWPVRSHSERPLQRHLPLQLRNNHPR